MNICLKATALNYLVGSGNDVASAFRRGCSNVMCSLGCFHSQYTVSLIAHFNSPFSFPSGRYREWKNTDTFWKNATNKVALSQGSIENREMKKLIY